MVFTSFGLHPVGLIPLPFPSLSLSHAIHPPDLKHAGLQAVQAEQLLKLAAVQRARVESRAVPPHPPHATS